MNPTTAVFAYWREHLGDVRLDKITSAQVAMHRDRLLGADCCGHHKSAKPRSNATVRVRNGPLSGRRLQYRYNEREIPASPQARVTPKLRSVIKTLTAARLACGLTIFGAADPSALPCPAQRPPAAA